MGALYSEDERVEISPILVPSVMDFFCSHMEPDKNGNYSTVIEVSVDMLLDWRYNPLCNCGRPECEAHKLQHELCKMFEDNCNRKLVFTPMTIPPYMEEEASRRIAIVVKYVNEGFGLEDSTHIVEQLYKKL